MSDVQVKQCPVCDQPEGPGNPSCPCVCHHMGEMIEEKCDHCGGTGKALHLRDGVPLELPCRHCLKPRTTVKRFADDLKERIERAAVTFDRSGSPHGTAQGAGMRYVGGIVDAALSDYDVRDPGDST